MLLLFIYNCAIGKIFKDIRLFLKLIFNLKIENKKCSQCFLNVVIATYCSKRTNKSLNLNKVADFILFFYCKKHEKLEE